MATKTKKVSKVKVVRKTKKEAPIVIRSHSMGIRWAFIVGVCVLGLIGFWYKTNSWPVVAIVNNLPITRFELNQMMYDKVGKEALDTLITQKLVVRELKRQKIVVSARDIDTKLEEIKAQLGTDENFNQILELQGVTMEELRNQIEFQLKLEKLVPASTDSAQLQEDISATLSALRSKAKIWTLK